MVWRCVVSEFRDVESRYSKLSWGRGKARFQAMQKPVFSQSLGYIFVPEEATSYQAAAYSRALCGEPCIKERPHLWQDSAIVT